MNDWFAKITPPRMLRMVRWAETPLFFQGRPFLDPGFIRVIVAGNLMPTPWLLDGVLRARFVPTLVSTVSYPPMLDREVIIIRSKDQGRGQDSAFP